jgi:folate-binding protein YgfZ
MSTPGYQAILNGSAVIDYSARGRIRATGADRARLLHALCTNDVASLRPGQSAAVFFLNPQGRILADADIYGGDDWLLIDVEPEAREKIFRHIDRYIIADDVTLEDVTDTTAELCIIGEAPAGTVIEGTLIGVAGCRVVIPIDAPRPALPVATLEDARVVRIENGVPRYGEEITEAHLVQETGLMARVHSNKGCYIGQEIVERVRSRGQLHRSLRALRVTGTAVPAAGEKVLSGEKEAGEIASAVFSNRFQEIRALAWLRSLDSLSVAGAAAQLIQQA